MCPVIPVVTTDWSTEMPLEAPKSEIFAFNQSSSNMLVVLMSLCTTEVVATE